MPQPASKGLIRIRSNLYKYSANWQEEGSFYNNVLDLFKRSGNEPESSAANFFVEEVSQVRRYRNWVAHGRRPEKKPFMLVPKDAFDRLMAFLQHIGYRIPA
jgi:hypothetical protein